MLIFGRQEVDQRLLYRESKQVDSVRIISALQNAREVNLARTEVDDEVRQREQAKYDERLVRQGPNRDNESCDGVAWRHNQTIVPVEGATTNDKRNNQYLPVGDGQEIIELSASQYINACQAQ